MDDIIVILLTLLIMVVGAISQIKKKQKQPLQEETLERKTTGLNFWEEFLDVEDNSGINAEPVVQEVIAPVVVPDPEPVIKPVVKDGIKGIQSNYIRDIIKDTQISSYKKGANLPEGFSLRKAVIFSEILDHKYF
ncbi:MAG: hypothetical protein JW833_06345 [Prolixibacteraceae bacterium]|nr:hypothetical protein [Prolixibacteraceae bacterium]